MMKMNLVAKAVASLEDGVWCHKMRRTVPNASIFSAMRSVYVSQLKK